MDPAHATRTAVWVDRFEDVGLIMVVAASLGWLALGCVAWVDGLLTGFVEVVAAFATPAQWLLPLAGIGILLQVLPRALAAGLPAPDRRPWRVIWAAAFFTLLAAVFFGAGWVALFAQGFSGSLFTSVGNLFFYWSFAVVAGALAALGWASIGLFRPRDWESWSDPGEADDEGIGSD
jgi:hypothetical protein